MNVLGVVVKVGVLIQYIAGIEDKRQQWKVKYPIEEIITIVLFATLGNANEWKEMKEFAKAHETTLKKYLTLKKRMVKKPQLGDFT